MKHTLLSFLMFAFSVTLFAQTKRYVKPTATGSGNGSSWVNASGDLQLMINGSSANDQVWVAAGTYLPNRRGDALTVITVGDRNNAFVLKADVKIYGGFSGTETLLTQRDLILAVNASVLSGDLGTPNVNSDNAYHVVISAGNVGTAELNGFTIAGGNANGLGINYITVNSGRVVRNQGGGMFNVNSSPRLSQLVFRGNTAETDGGGMFNTGSSPIVSNVVFTGNNALSGAGIYNTNSSNASLSDVVLSENVANYAGGGMFNASSSPLLYRVKISGNTAANHGGGILNLNTSSPRLTYVSISGNSVTYNGGGMANYSSCIPILTNVSISGNRGALAGGGIYNNESAPVIRNTVIHGNNSGIANESSVPVIAYSGVATGIAIEK